MNTTKAIAALDNAAKELEALYDSTIQAGRKDPAHVRAAQSVAKAGLAVEKAKGRLTEAVDKVTPKEKPAKDAKKSDKK